MTHWLVGHHTDRHLGAVLWQRAEGSWQKRKDGGGGGGCNGGVCAIGTSKVKMFSSCWRFSPPTLPFQTASKQQCSSSPWPKWITQTKWAQSQPVQKYLYSIQHREHYNYNTRFRSYITHSCPLYIHTNSYDLNMTSIHTWPSMKVAGQTRWRHFSVPPSDCKHANNTSQGEKQQQW